MARDTGRRRLRRLGAAVGVLALLGIAWAVVSSPLLDVDRIEVVGADRTGRDAVRRASGIEHGDPLLNADVGRAEDRVADLPWVASAEATRQWPGAVRIVVEERAPVAAAALPGEGGGWMLLGPEGHQLERVGELPAESLVVLEGVEPARRPGGVLEAAVGALEAVAVVPDGFTGRLTTVRVADDGDLEAVVELPDDGGEIVAVLGPPVDLPEKLVAVATVVEQADLTGANAINVRVPASPVLTRQPGPE